MRTLKLLVFATLLIGLASCDRDNDLLLDNDTDLDLATNTDVRSVEGGGCFEIEYPINILVDDEEVEVSSREEAKVVLQTWKESGDKSNRPRIVYPITVETEEGDVLDIDSRRELARLVRQCRGKGTPRKPCFKMNYPVSITYPDGSVQAYEDRLSLRRSLRQWRIENRGSADRPHLVYPISVTLKDGSTTTVSSKEDLMDLREGC